MRWVFTALIYVGAGVTMFALWKGRVNSVPVPEVESAPTVRRRSGSRIFADGIVEGAQPDISPRFEISGRISAVHVRENQQVAAGDVLAELEPDVAQLRLNEAQTRLTVARAEREQLTAELKQEARDRRVQQTGTERPAREPGTKMDAAREAAANARIELAETAIRHEELLLEKHRLRAPRAGLIVRATAEPGEFTGPADERELFIIASVDKLRVRAFVEEFDALRVVTGLRAVVTAMGDQDRQYAGTVVSCAPSVRHKLSRHLKPGERVDLRVRDVMIELDRGAELLLGLPVEVFIERDLRTK